MDQQDPPSDQTTIAVGGITAAGGLYFVLVALGVMPAPGEAHAPAGIVFCAGLAFMLAGIAVVIRAATGTRDSASELPTQAPRWAKAAYHLVGLAAAGALAAIGSWIALGAGPRAFEIATQFGSGHGAETFGRAVFGIGAAIVCIYVIAVAISGARRLLGRSKS
jgi:hypothetical protein